MIIVPLIFIYCQCHPPGHTVMLGENFVFWFFGHVLEKFPDGFSPKLKVQLVHFEVLMQISERFCQIFTEMARSSFSYSPKFGPFSCFLLPFFRSSFSSSPELGPSSWYLLLLIEKNLKTFLQNVAYHFLITSKNFFFNLQFFLTIFFKNLSQKFRFFIFFGFH